MSEGAAETIDREAMQPAHEDGRRRIEVDRCSVCGAVHEFSVQFRDDPYEVRRCQRCTFVWVSPRYDNDGLAEVYDDGYWQSDSPKTRGYANYAEERELYLRTFRHRMKLVRRFMPTDRPARVLDVGCAAGFFLTVMREQGHDVYGVEPSVISATAVETLGADRVHAGLLEDVVAGKAEFAGPFDLVTMWDVIEHVPEPVQLLTEARSLLRPDGHLVLETQNVDSRFAKLLGPKWHHFKHEEHIYHFNRSTLQRTLHQAGFETLHTSPSYGGKFVSLEFVAERAGRVHPLLGRLLGLMMRPFGRAAVYVNLRDELIAGARPAGGNTAAS